MKKLLLLSALVATVVTSEVQASGAMRNFFMGAGAGAGVLIGVSKYRYEQDEKKIEMVREIQAINRQTYQLGLGIASSKIEVDETTRWLHKAQEAKGTHNGHSIKDLEWFKRLAWAGLDNRTKRLKELEDRRDELCTELLK